MDNRILGIQGWMGEVELDWLSQMTKKQRPDALIVELGAWRGRSTAGIVVSMSPSMTVITVDTWLGQYDLRTTAHSDVMKTDLFLEFMDNMKIFGITPKWYSRQHGGLYYLRMDSALAPLLFDNDSVDMLFIDCDHRRFGEDIDSWKEKVKPHGIISGHDYYWEGAKEAIDKRVLVEELIGDIWWGYKD